MKENSNCPVCGANEVHYIEDIYQEANGGIVETITKIDRNCHCGKWSRKWCWENEAISEMERHEMPWLHGCR